ncbi:hypothetical protein [Maridesulfovibrio hydrothermalis]|uniref:Uncharacterized protein n=1 Tax=Maridesulfovibrio hydrothermalis AM13 = DSM 14728 TaxID=1121451 RepID=L0RBZ9_9BACT|nr:hypothetical protein [Maridesulfovibrio hydrothermalis]CCO24279.1 protein of unknown function [Maridesulfovibrio hydrothermalis AM13 = DSM 14728]
MKADIFTVDIDKTHLKPVYNPLSHIIHCAGGQDVRLTVCGRKFFTLMENI